MWAGVARAGWPVKIAVAAIILAGAALLSVWVLALGIAALIAAGFANNDYKLPFEEERNYRNGNEGWGDYVDGRRIDLCLMDDDDPSNV
jgi:hypothetical protein